MEETILAIRLRQLGDIIATLGALKALKRGDPRRRILFMIDEQYHPFLGAEPYIDELLAPPPRIAAVGDGLRFTRFIDRLRSRPLSCVIDFHSNPRSALITYLSGASRRIGFDVRMRKAAYTEIAPRASWKNGRKIPENSHQSALKLARRAGAIRPEAEALCEITITPDAGRSAGEKFDELGIGAGAVGLNPGNPYPAKAWPDERFIELCRRLTDRKRRVVVLWGPGERDKAEGIARRAGGDVQLAPRLSLTELPPFLKRLSLVVTIDSGLKHVAVAARVPTVTLFGPTSWAEWHIGTGSDRVVSCNFSCSPCRLLRCPFGAPCMGAITVDRVLAAAEPLLNP